MGMVEKGYGKERCLLHGHGLLIQADGHGLTHMGYYL
jgi:hypothetical protein